ncbi:MAG: DUF479 domain-containing protein [Geobacter sp.]|nr:DUF479 domain-containing protein [Geobacter sp.]
MNFLAHLHLSGTEPEVLVGNFMGDFVKGRIGEEYPPLIRQGLMLHRGIDGFANMHPAFIQSRQRLDQRFGLYRAVLVDLFYDHFLSVEWGRWSDVPFDEYIAGTRRVVEEYRHVLPLRLQEIVPLIFEELIPSYLEIEGIGRALGRMARRIRRDNPLGEGAGELERHYDVLREDFRRFMPDAEGFVRDFLSEGRVR